MAPAGLRARAWYRDPLLSLPALTVVAVAVALIDPRSVFFFAYFFALTLATYRVLFGAVRAEVVWLFAAYGAGSVLLYLTQLWTLPEYMGFSGGQGVGSDDCRFWGQVADTNVGGLPTDCLWLSLHKQLPYSEFVSGVMPGAIVHPLNVLFINVWGMALLPLVTREVALRLSRSQVAARWAFWLSAICPFTLSNSLILVRDGWTAVGFITAILMLLQRRYVLMILVTAFVFYLRSGSGALVAGAVAGMALIVVPNSATDRVSRMVRRLAVVVLAALGVGAVAVAVLPQLVTKGVGDALLREDFLVNFIGAHTPDSTLYAIMNQPLVVRLPLAFAFFFGSPFFKPEAILVDGLFVPRNFMAAVAFPVVFLVSVRHFVRGAVYALSRRDNMVLMAFAMFAIVLLLISQSSLQMRHKTLIMPLFYVLVGYGAVYSTRTGRSLGAVVAAAVFVVEVLFLLR